MKTLLKTTFNYILILTILIGFASLIYFTMQNRFVLNQIFPKTV